MLWSLLLVSLGMAQTPHDAWERVDTQHYRVHFPSAAEAWSLQLARQLDSVHDALVEEVGWGPDRKIDVVVVDPYSGANGSAWPFVGHPRMLLYASPPSPDGGLSHGREWGELLAVHEGAHMLHLMRDSRNGTMKAVQDVIGFAPITLNTPRWAIEGYATVVEGRLTGLGRPHSDGRATALRVLAQQGQMPAYRELNGSGEFMGYTHAYLVGSSFLEWLERREGEGVLRDLWARQTAKQTRDFDDAFRGLFGDSASALYGEFVAELVAESVRIDDAIQWDEGTEFLALDWYSGGPAVSPSGELVAAVHSRKEQPSKLTVWRVEEDLKPLIDHFEAVGELLENDPEDVPDRPPRLASHKKEASRTFVSRPAGKPAWIDEERLVFPALFEEEGRYRFDLVVWNHEDDEEVRLTHEADLRSVQVASGGEFAVAKRMLWAESQIVKVDLASGEWEPLTEMSLTNVDSPAVSPDGEWFAWLELGEHGWFVQAQRFDGEGAYDWKPEFGGPQPISLAFSPDGLLIASVGWNGFIDVMELGNHESEGRGWLTTARGGANQATMDSTGALWFQSMHPTGFRIHRSVDPQPRKRISASGTTAAVRKDATKMPHFAPELPVAHRPGRTELRPLIGGVLGYGDGIYGQGEGGLRIGGILGRFDALALASYGSTTGGRLSVAYRRFPVHVGGTAYVADDAVVGTNRGGFVGALKKRWAGATWALNGKMGGWADTGLANDPFASRVRGFAGLSFGAFEKRQRFWTVTSMLRASGGVTGDELATLYQGSARLYFGDDALVSLQVTADYADADLQLDRPTLGGLAGSIQPSEVLWARMQDPAFAFGTASGAAHDSMSAHVGPPDGQLFIVRHMFGESADLFGENPLKADGWTAVGSRSQLSIGPSGFQRIPVLQLDSGFAYQVERGGDWIDELKVEGDAWSVWMKLGYDL